MKNFFNLIEEDTEFLGAFLGVFIFGVITLVYGPAYIIFLISLIGWLGFLLLPLLFLPGFVIGYIMGRIMKRVIKTAKIRVILLFLLFIFFILGNIVLLLLMPSDWYERSNDFWYEIFVDDEGHMYDR